MIFTAGRLLAAVEILVSAYASMIEAVYHFLGTKYREDRANERERRGGEPMIGFGPMAYYTDWLLSSKLILHLILEKETTLLL